MFTSPDDIYDEANDDFDGILTLFKSDDEILDYIMMKEESIDG